MIRSFADILHTGNKSFRINVYAEIVSRKGNLCMTFYNGQADRQQEYVSYYFF